MLLIRRCLRKIGLFILYLCLELFMIFSSFVRSAFVNGVNRSRICNTLADFISEISLRNFYSKINRTIVEKMLLVNLTIFMVKFYGGIVAWNKRWKWTLDFCITVIIDISPSDKHTCGIQCIVFEYFVVKMHCVRISSAKQYRPDWQFAVRKI